MIPWRKRSKPCWSRRPQRFGWRFGKAGLPAGRLLDLPAVFEDPQVLHNEMLVRMEHNNRRTHQSHRFPPASQRVPGPGDRSPASAGADTRRILLEAGLADPDIDRLASEKAVVAGTPE